MIVLFTHDKRIEIPSSNPAHDELVEFDGKFLGVTLIPEDAPAPIEPEELITVDVDSTGFLEHLEELFDPKSVTFALLQSHVNSCMSLSGSLTITKESQDRPYKVARTRGGILIVPERFINETSGD